VTTRAFCTILSSNYLPKALVLAESLRRHEDGARLKILFIDIPHDDGLPDLDGVDCLSTAVLGLSDRRVLELATAYELVEFATAVKPLLLQALLEDAEQVFYLDPDTYLTAPMVELTPALAASVGGILLTPHFLHPAGHDGEFSDGHMLLVGVNNLGFCGVDRRAGAFLDWWWGHLISECLFDPLAGLFVDQKWMDIGSSLFEAASFRHPGYNIGIGNLPERPLAQDADGYSITTTGDRLRLFHFHAFDSSAPERLSTRFRHTEGNELAEDSIVLQLCKEYAETLIGYEQSLPAAPPYPYWNDTNGRRITRQHRRAYGRQIVAGASLPSPFIASEAAAYDKWRRRARGAIAKALVDEGAKCLRIILPEEYDAIKKRFPKVTDRLNNRFSDGSGMWK
jgi:hypothetical protein